MIFIATSLKHCAFIMSSYVLFGNMSLFAIPILMRPKKVETAVPSC